MAMVEMPNILYIHSHDSGRYVQPYGYPVETPNIQKLAERGVLFRKAFCAGPTCSPSRAALLTGQSPHASGMMGLAHRGWRLNDYSQHILHTLRPHGYTSVLTGFQHIAKEPFAEVDQIGFDVDLRSNWGDDDCANNACRFLEDRPSEPFFMDVGFTRTHAPFPEQTREDDPRYVMPPAPLPDHPDTRRTWAGYRTLARNLDRTVGQVVDALERSGMGRRTLVISTTDHGIALPDMKCNLTDHGLGVSLIMAGPREFTGGKVIDSMVSQIDIFPTLCDWLGIEPPDWVEGRSVMPVVRGEVESVNEEIFGEVTYHASYEPKRAVRTDRWKYIRRFDGRTRPNLPNCDASAAKSHWLDADWSQREVPEQMLFDLEFDPQERRNLAESPQHAATLEDMRNRLDAWMQRTDDPIRRGPVLMPEGGLANDPDELHPTPRGATVNWRPPGA